jgi:L-fucose isomerase-like protein
VKPLTVAFVPLARTTFDLPLAEEVTRTARAQLEAAGLSTVGPSELVTDLPAAEKVANALAQDPVDLLLVFQATFADSTMVTALTDQINAPILLWAIPEARTGGRLRLNSFCGINLAGHALTIQGRGYEYLYAEPDHPDALAKVKALAQAGQVVSLLKQARLGVVGEHPDGLDTCHLDAPLLKSRLGVDVLELEIETVFERAKAVDEKTLMAVRANLENRLEGLETLEQKPLRGTTGVYSALKQIVLENNLQGIAVRCWPEFFTELGCAACGAMSMLSDEQIPCSCEADINGTITQLILQWLSGEPAFGSDLVSMDFDEDSAVLWHCGLAPLAMADPAVPARGGIHSNRQVPLVMEFPLKPGRVTIARLSQASGELRLVVGRGEMLSAPPSFTGTSGVVRFERPAQEIFDVILGEGLEHHLSITYGDHKPALLALAELLNLPVLNL